MYQMGWSAQHRQRTSRTGGEPGAIRQRCFLFLRKWCQWAASVSWNACRGGYWHAARRWWSVSQLSLFSWPFLQPHPQILIPESGESHLQLSPLSAISDNNSMGRSKWIDHTFSPEESYHPVFCPCLALFTKYQPWFLPFLGLAALKPSGATLLLRCWSSTHLHPSFYTEDRLHRNFLVYSDIFPKKKYFYIDIQVCEMKKAFARGKRTRLAGNAKSGAVWARAVCWAANHSRSFYGWLRQAKRYFAFFSFHFFFNQVLGKGSPEPSNEKAALVGNASRRVGMVRLLLIRYTWVWYYLWDHRFFGGCKYWSAEDTACRLVNINILTWDLELFSIATPGKQKLACPRSW